MSEPEAQLKIELLRRSTRQMTPTGAGQFQINACKPVIEQVDGAGPGSWPASWRKANRESEGQVLNRLCRHGTEWSGLTVREGWKTYDPQRFASLLGLTRTGVQSAVVPCYQVAA
jgi:hypothetical protein